MGSSEFRRKVVNAMGVLLRWFINHEHNRYGGGITIKKLTCNRRNVRKRTLSAADGRRIRPAAIRSNTGTPGHLSGHTFQNPARLGNTLTQKCRRGSRARVCWYFYHAALLSNATPQKHKKRIHRSLAMWEDTWITNYFHIFNPSHLIKDLMIIREHI